MSILEATLRALSHAFGEPVCRGDCCWWTLSRDGLRPVRLSVFIDGGEEQEQRAEGWVCDLQDPARTVRRFVIEDLPQVEPLIAQVNAMLAETDQSDAGRTGALPPSTQPARQSPDA